MSYSVIPLTRSQSDTVYSVGSQSQGRRSSSQPRAFRHCGDTDSACPDSLPSIPG